LVINEELRKRQKAAQNSTFQTEIPPQTEKTSRETPEIATTTKTTAISKQPSALYWLSYLELLVLTHSSDKADLTNGWHRSCRFNILYVR